MDDKKKLGYGIVIATIAGLTFLIFSFKDQRTRQEPLDPWVAPADKLRPWAEQTYQNAVHPAKPFSGKQPLTPTAKIVTNTSKKIELSYSVQGIPDLPSKIVNLKPSELFEHLIVSKLINIDVSGEPEVQLDGLQPVVIDPLNLKLSLHSKWKNGSIFSQIKGIPRIACQLVEPYKNLTFKKLQIFDQKTHVRVAHSNDIITDVTLLHPTPVTITIDLYDETELSAPLTAIGTIADLSNFQYKHIASLHNYGVSGSGSGCSGHQADFELRFSNWNNDGVKFTYHIIEWSNPNLIRNSGLKITTTSGQEIFSIIESQNDQMAVYITPVNPTDIKNIEIYTKPFFTRYITELNELPGMPEMNRGVTDLFDIKIPNYIQHESLPTAQGKLTQLTQLRPNTYHSSYNSEKPKNHGEITVREIIQKWQKLDSAYWFQVNKTDMEYLYHEDPRPLPPTYGEKYLP